MSQVQKMTEALIRTIEESEEYTRYQNAKQVIIRYPVLKEKADEFRRHNYEFQNSNVDHFEEGDKLLEEFIRVSEHPIVWEYLTAENAFCRVLRQMNWQLLGKLNLDFDLELGFMMK